MRVKEELQNDCRNMRKISDHRNLHRDLGADPSMDRRFLRLNAMDSRQNAQAGLGCPPADPLQSLLMEYSEGNYLKVFYSSHVVQQSQVAQRAEPSSVVILIFSP